MARASALWLQAREFDPGCWIQTWPVGFEPAQVPERRKILFREVTRTGQAPDGRTHGRTHGHEEAPDRGRKRKSPDTFENFDQNPFTVTSFVLRPSIRLLCTASRGDSESAI